MPITKTWSNERSIKKTFSAAYRHVPTKYEDVSNTEYAFLTEDFSQMTTEGGLNKDHKYNPFRSKYSHHMIKNWYLLQ